MKLKQDRPLSPLQLHTLHHLLNGRSITDAARLAGVHRTTVHAWCRRDRRFAAAFQQSLEGTQARIFADLQEASGHAISALQDVMGNADASAPARVRAALGVLNIVRSTNSFPEIRKPVEYVPRDLDGVLLDQLLDPDEPRQAAA